MEVKYEYIGFVIKGELLIKEIGNSKFIILPPPLGMFYIIPDSFLEISLKCKACGTSSEFDNEILVLVGNDNIMGVIECKLCDSHSIVVFNKATVINLIRKMKIDPNLVREHWGFAHSLSNN